MGYRFNVRDEFLVGSDGAMFIKEKIKALIELERIRAMKHPQALIVGGKPWPDRPGPWGDSDGEDNGAYETDPGEESNKQPAQEDADGDYDAKGLRDLCSKLSMKVPQNVAMDLLQIEARLGECTMFLRTAIPGVSGKARAALEQFNASL